MCDSPVTHDEDEYTAALRAQEDTSPADNSVSSINDGNPKDESKHAECPDQPQYKHADTKQESRWTWSQYV